MRFYSIYRTPLYVVDGGANAMRDVDGRTVPKIPMLAAHFAENLFDSEDAQKRLGWTDEQRERVEQHLMGLEGYGSELRLAEEAERIRDLGPLHGAKACVFGKPTDEGYEVCGEPVSDGPYCSEHARIVAEATKPKKAKQAVA